MVTNSEFLDLLKDRITLSTIPFTDRDSRIMLFRQDDALQIRLAEFWSNRDDFVTVDQWRFIDGGGQSLTGVFTTFPHRVDYHTSSGTFTIAFADAETLLVALPPGRCGTRFQVRAEQTGTDRRGGVLQLHSKLPCTLVYTTNARLVRNEIVALSTGVQEVQLTMECGGDAALLLNIIRTQGYNRWVPRAEAILDAAARRWHGWFAAAPTVDKTFQRQYYYAWWVLAINLLYPRFHPKREGLVPSKLHYVGIWLWDAFFHAIAYRHVDMRLAQDQFRIMLDHQLPNGMIPDVVHDDGIIAHSTAIVEADVTKPPLMAWAVWKLYEIDSDKEFLDEIYEPLVRWQKWWFAECDTDGNGLCEYLHPYSSGLDDNPLWDDGLPVESPDLNAYLCLQYDYLAKIAEVIGERDEARIWAAEAERLAQRMVEVMWDEQAGIFRATRNGVRVNVTTPFHLFPLITGRMPARIADRLAARLTNPVQFWTRFPTPTVARDDLKHDPLTMWRGPTWVNVNYLLIDGLVRAGYSDVAAELRRRTIEMVMTQPDIYEYYHPETGEKPPGAVGLFGWSAALFVDLVLQIAGKTRRTDEDKAE